MNLDDAQTCLNAVKARWPHQPMNDDQRMAWTRTLRKLTLEVFGDTLDLFVERGGSGMTSQPGQRPGVGEFMGTAATLTTRAIRAGQQAERQAEPLPSNASAAEHLAEIRDQNPHLKAKVRA